jgi:hypothetical protein
MKKKKIKAIPDPLRRTGESIKPAMGGGNWREAYIESDPPNKYPTIFISMLCKSDGDVERHSKTVAEIIYRYNNFKESRAPYRLKFRSRPTKKRRPHAER